MPSLAGQSSGSPGRGLAPCRHTLPAHMPAAESALAALCTSSRAPPHPTSPQSPPPLEPPSPAQWHHHGPRHRPVQQEPGAHHHELLHHVQIHDARLPARVCVRVGPRDVSGAPGRAFPSTGGLGHARAIARLVWGAADVAAEACQLEHSQPAPTTLPTCRPSWSLAGVVGVIVTGLLLLVKGEAKFDATGFALVMTAACMSGLRFTLTQVRVGAGFGCLCRHGLVVAEQGQFSGRGRLKKPTARWEQHPFKASCHPWQAWFAPNPTTVGTLMGPSATACENQSAGAAARQRRPRAM